jgi:serine/threonine protein kinase/Tol biopolymer transport system component
MPLSSGDKLGPYEIVEPIGKGGMGEVYKADDPRTGRELAIKLCAERFSERFEREVRAIASLNHPNICTLYDVGPNYLAMELVEGETLANRIRRGPIPLDAALPIARQVAAALEAAHEKGIIHRDLKPGNIKIKPDDTVKVLDFGLAKVTANAASDGDPEESPTRTMESTQAGVILGTAAYMAPEQARGKPVDKRADIWAFGVVVYEMLTGKRLFEGENPTEVLAGIIKEQPDLNLAPVEMRRLLARCLEKDPRRRLRDIGDVWELLEQQPGLAGPPTPPRPAVTQKLAWATAAVLLVSIAVFALLWRRTSTPETLSAQFEISPPGGMHFTNTLGDVAVSPDGRNIVFSAAEDQGFVALWLRPLGSLAAEPLQGTEGADFVFWSPDSKSIGFYQGGKLMRADIAGGPPRVLCDAVLSGGAGGTWNRDGTILFTSGADIFRVPASGGSPRQITSLNKSRKEIASGPPQFLPDGKHFLNLVRSEDPSATGIYAISLDRPQERVWIVATNRKATYLPPRGGQPGYLLWVRGQMRLAQTLLAQPFDAGKLKLEDDPAPVVESVQSQGTAGVQASFWGSDAGVLAYRAARGAGRPSKALTWFDRQGKDLGTVGKLESYGEIALSPDGSQIAAFRRDNLGEGLWLIDLVRASSLRLSTDQANESYPVWSPDGKQIAYGRLIGRLNTSGGGLYRRPAGVSSTAELLLKNEDKPLDWSRDGRFLLFAHSQSPTQVDLWVLPMGEAERKPVKYLATGFRLRHGSFSPDGRWVMYTSNISGRDEIYVSPFPDASAAPAVPVSTAGGQQARWRGDGRAVYYFSPDSRLEEVEVLQNSSLKVGIPKPLFESRISNTAEMGGWYWDISQDGRRFLFNIQMDQAKSAQETAALAPLIVITNWQSRLKR